MTKEDFDIIIVESLAHVQRKDFFKVKKKETGYSKEGYACGLMDSVIRLNYEVNLTDCYHYRLIKADGTISEGVLSADFQVYRIERQRLERSGQLTFPFKRCIEIKREGQFLFQFTSCSIAEIWPDLYSYLSPINTHLQLPPIPQCEEPFEDRLSTIQLPEDVARHFAIHGHEIFSNHKPDEESGAFADEPLFIDSNLSAEPENQPEDVYSQDLPVTTIGNEDMEQPARQRVMAARGLKVNQVALIYVYGGLQITRENAGEIAAAYGFVSKTSGEGLFQDFSTYSSAANRKGKPTLCTPRKLMHKISLIDSIIGYLTTENAKETALSDLKSLREIYENEYQ